MQNGQIHFISGLPRSGSTLLSAILKQNPRFHAGVVSPLLSLMNVMQPAVSGGEFMTFFDEARRAAILRGVFSSYYADQAGKLVFDTNRLWNGRLAFVHAMYPSAKIITCVRQPAWILDSFEQSFRRNPLQTTASTSYATQASLHSRMEILANGETGVLGLAWNALRDGWHSKEAAHMIIIDYDRLVDDPAGIIARLYAALGEKPFAHDFNALDHEEEEFDATIGMPGLHKVRPKIERIPRATCLPPEVFSKYDTPMFWREPSANGALIL